MNAYITSSRAPENSVPQSENLPLFSYYFYIVIFLNFDGCVRTESFDSENMRDLVDVYLKEMQASSSPDFHGNMLEVNSS